MSAGKLEKGTGRQKDKSVELLSLDEGSTQLNQGGFSIITEYFPSSPASFTSPGSSSSLSSSSSSSSTVSSSNINSDSEMYAFPLGLPESRTFAAWSEQGLGEIKNAYIPKPVKLTSEGFEEIGKSIRLSLKKIEKYIERHAKENASRKAVIEEKIKAQLESISELTKRLNSKSFSGNLKEAILYSISDVLFECENFRTSNQSLSKMLKSVLHELGLKIAPGFQKEYDRVYKESRDSSQNESKKSTFTRLFSNLFSKPVNEASEEEEEEDEDDETEDALENNSDTPSKSTLPAFKSPIYSKESGNKELEEAKTTSQEVAIIKPYIMKWLTQIKDLKNDLGRRDRLSIARLEKILDDMEESVGQLSTLSLTAKDKQEIRKGLTAIKIDELNGHIKNCGISKNATLLTELESIVSVAQYKSEPEVPRFQ